MFTFTLNTSFTANVSGNQLTVTAVGANTQIGAVFTATLTNTSYVITQVGISLIPGMVISSQYTAPNCDIVSQSPGTTGDVGA